MPRRSTSGTPDAAPAVAGNLAQIVMSAVMLAAALRARRLDPAGRLRG